MQLLTINSAKAIWLFDLLDLNPKGRVIDAQLMEWLKSTYKFLKFPSSPLDFDENTQTLSFIGGSYSPSGTEEPIYVDLLVYRDGLVGSTRYSTRATEEFLNEALLNAASVFNLPFRPDLIRKKLYLSDLEVRLDRPLNLLNPVLPKVSSKASSLLGGVSFGFDGLLFSPEPRPMWQYSPFKLERKLNTPWSENRYYSVAPFHTDDHLALIEEIESSVHNTSLSKV